MIGSLRPFASLNRSQASAVALSPRMAVHGSPGSSRTRQEHEEQDPDQDGYRDQDAAQDVTDHVLYRSVERGEALVRLPPSSSE